MSLSEQLKSGHVRCVVVTPDGDGLAVSAGVGRNRFVRARCETVEEGLAVLVRKLGQQPPEPPEMPSVATMPGFD